MRYANYIAAAVNYFFTPANEILKPANEPNEIISQHTDKITVADDSILEPIVERKNLLDEPSARELLLQTQQRAKEDSLPMINAIRQHLDGINSTAKKNEEIKIILQEL